MTCVSTPSETYFRSARQLLTRLRSLTTRLPGKFNSAGDLVWTVPLLLLALFAHGLQAQTNFGSLALKTTSAPQTVTLTSAAGGTVANLKTLTLGASNLDFAYVSDTCVNAVLPAGGTCTVTASFTPAYPGLRMGAIVLLDGSDHVIGTSYLVGTGLGGLGVFVPGTIQTVAGSAALTGLGDGGPATSAFLKLPTSVTEDGAGNIYIADSDHNRIRFVTVPPGSATGQISTIAGTGLANFSGDGGPAKDATLSNPSGIAVDSSGNVYIADTGNNAVRKIDAFTGNISTIAGSPVGTPGGTGDGGPATAAFLNGPNGVSVDVNGNVYIADTANQRIREVAVATGIITTVAGDGTQGFSANFVPATSTSLNNPYAVAFDASGNMYIPDSSNNIVQKVSTAGIISIVAGNGASGRIGDGGPALDANLHLPTGVAIDPAGNLYIADTQNSSIRKVSATTGIINKIAGGNAALYGGDGGSALKANMYGPQGMYIDVNGNLLIADVFDNRIREIQSNLATENLTLTPVREGTVSAPQPQTVENDGTAALSLTSITPGANTAVDAASTTCTTATPLAEDADCNIGAEFAPTTIANPLTGTIDIVGVTPNTPLVIQIMGDAVAQTTTTTTSITSAPNPSVVLSPVTFTASVTGVAGVPTGTVTFLADGAAIGTGALSASGTATLVYSGLTVGTHAITASYGGDAGDASSISAPISQVVQPISTVTILDSSTTAATPPQVILFATVVGTSGPTPTGTVTFVTGATTLGTVTLDTTGAATLNPTLAVGTYSIVAKYSGDTLHSPSVSAAVSITVSSVPAGFNLTVTPPTITMATKQNKTVTVALTSVNSFTDTIGLGCASLPASVTCHFSSISVSLPSNGVQKVQLTIDTNNPLSGGTQAMDASRGNRGLYAASLIFPVSALFGFALWRQRKRHAGIWSAGILLVLAGAALLATGCGGFTQVSAAPGTYTIQVTGVGENTKTISYQSVTLTITQ